MSSIVTSNNRRLSDRFEPQDSDPYEQRRIRGQLEQIDFTAFVSNREVLGQMVGQPDLADFQKLAVLVATSRAKWAAEGIRLAQSGAPVTPDQTARLAAARAAYEELAEVYEALRRMVERGYVQFRVTPER